MSGFLATLLATPCSAPLVGTAVSFALSGLLVELSLIVMMMGRACCALVRAGVVPPLGVADAETWPLVILCSACFGGRIGADHALVVMVDFTHQLGAFGRCVMCGFDADLGGCLLCSAAVCLAISGWNYIFCIGVISLAQHA